MTTSISPTRDLDTPDTGRFGSKAANLGIIARAGINSPEGVAIPVDRYIEFLGSVDLPDRDPETPFRDWARTVHHVLIEATLPDGLLDDLTEALATLPTGTPWIVRSSAVGEDAAGSSFAGQLDSIADVNPDDPDNLGDAIRRVWASAWGDRAAIYRDRLGLTEPDDLPVGVLIQPFIEPNIAGIMFTASPVPGESGTLIEAVQGRGETLVSGAATPARYLIGEIGDIADATATQPFDVPVSLLKELAATGHRLADMFGSPQDIEWVWADGELVIVQSRPITTLETPTADPADFVVTVVPVDYDNRDSIPDDMKAKDKFRLRMVATEAGIPIGRGWLVTARRRDAATTVVTEAGTGLSGLTVHDAAADVVAGIERFPQVSLVLQNPSRLDGEIVRQFTTPDNIEEHLARLVAKVGARYDEFSFIATEIFQAHMSGISHVVDDKLIAEVAYGSYVPKGVVPTSMYVVGADTTVEQHVEVIQATGIFIEGGKPIDRPVDAAAVLSTDQLGAIRHMTEVVEADYADVSVEFGVLTDCLPYLIDIIPDMSPVSVSDVRVMSTGRVSGRTRVAATDELAESSLDAHFHSERDAAAPTTEGEGVIVVAPQPFLALETYLADHGSQGIGFVFEQGSLLGHLAIILREHGVPAVVIPDATTTFAEGQLVTIDTDSDNLVQNTTETLVTEAAADA